MVRRTRLLALITLAMINVFTLAAGITVARMLPVRLAALKVPYVASAHVAVAGQVLAPGTQGPVPTTAGLQSALNAALSSSSLGPQVLALVTDPLTGQVLLSEGGTDLSTPASTTKLTTATAALALLGGGARFDTRVVQSSPGRLILVGGGDPTLAVNPYPPGSYPEPATLAALAIATAARLKSQGHASVTLDYDTSLYSGPGLAPGWPESYVSTGNVTQIVPLEVDQGRLTAAGAPEDVDDPGNFTPRAAHPAAMAAAAFVSLLEKDGVTVTGTPQEQNAPAGAPALASVSSPPLSALVAQMLAESNNVIAENLARHVAIAEGDSATFSAAAAAVIAELRRLGVTTPITLVDGSGLSPQDAIAPATLVKVIELAVATPRLRPLLAALPVAGFSGTLSAGQSVFGGMSGPALGMVRAKTGNLSSVATLAGLVYDKEGTLLAFAVMADDVTDLGEAAGAIDTAAQDLAGCGCR